MQKINTKFISAFCIIIFYLSPYRPNLTHLLTQCARRAEAARCSGGTLETLAIRPDTFASEHGGTSHLKTQSAPIALGFVHGAGLRVVVQLRRKDARCVNDDDVGFACI